MKNFFSQIFKLLILFPILMGILVSCNKKDEEEKEDKVYFYDPRVPFGNIDFNTSKIKDVTNLQADVSVLEEITLTWKIPPLYTTLPHKVVIFKRKSPPEGFDIVCPKPVGQFNSMCPGDAANATEIYLYKELESEIYRDWNELDENGFELNNVELDMDYTYWVFMKVNDNDWSNGVRLDVKSRTKESNFELPPPAKFWQYKRWSMGYDPYTSGDYGTVNSLYSLQQGIPSVGNYKGGLALAYSGNVIYVADTDNNRILIYSRNGALSCEEYTDEYEKSACLLQYQGAPHTATNILGQASAESTFPCGGPFENNVEPGGNNDGICDPGESCVNNPLEHNECLTRPSRVSVIGTRLFIMDSGNDRIVVYNNLPLNGCITDNGSGIITPRVCTPNRVIGKAGLFDDHTYDISIHGQSMLTNPTDVASKEGNLYIADTGNHRVVQIENFFNSDVFNCDSDSWIPGGLSTPKCQFKKVLGQRDFYYRETFNDLVDANPDIIMQDGLRDTIHPTYEDLLKRYFANPNRIIFNEDGKLLIGSNEMFSRPNAIGGKSALFSRILVFDDNPLEPFSGTCNPATFDSGNCDADDVFGQEQWNRLFTIGGVNEGSSYNQLQSGLYTLDDFDLVRVPVDGGEPNEMIVGVSSSNNEVYFWDNWMNITVAGKPKTNKAVNPEGAMHPSTGQLMPNLQGLCSVKVSLISTSVYIGDCAGNRVHEIQAADYIINAGQ